MTTGQGRLARELGLLDATIIVVSSILGGGIFFTPSQVARQLPSSTPILAAWAFGGIIALIIRGDGIATHHNPRCDFNPRLCERRRARHTSRVFRNRA